MLHLIRELRPLNYQQKLKKAKLLTLQTGSIQSQLITMHKMKFNHLDLHFNDFFIDNKCKKN